MSGKRQELIKCSLYYLRADAITASNYGKMASNIKPSRDFYKTLSTKTLISAQYFCYVFNLRDISELDFEGEN